MNTQPQEPAKNSDQDHTPTTTQVIMSVLAAAVGVQNRKNLERDFQHGKPRAFIIAGIIFTVLFVLLVIGAVQLALYFAK